MPRSSSSADSGSTSMLSDCPPSKPISIRTNSAMGNHLRENAVDGIGMDERDLETEQPFPRSRVDELRALAPQRVESLADVADLERDVVHARATRGEEPPHRRVAVERREQLDSSVADEHGGRLDALVGHPRAMLELRAEQARVGVERRIEVGDGDTEVMDAARVHPVDAIRRAVRGGGGSQQ